MSAVNSCNAPDCLAGFVEQAGLMLSSVDDQSTLCNLALRPSFHSIRCRAGRAHERQGRGRLFTSQYEEISTCATVRPPAFQHGYAPIDLPQHGSSKQHEWNRKILGLARPSEVVGWQDMGL